MKELSYCGQSCRFRNLGAEAFPLSASSRTEASWVSGNRLIRLISSTGHAPGHPLYSSREPKRAERRTLLKTLMDRPVAHVLPVIGLCSCAFETPFLDGVPLRDFALGPDANRLIHPQNRRPSWAPEALRMFLKDLAAGLAALHGIGIAHGDPALMNALIAEEGGARKAVWLDLNTVRPATEENRALDAAGFIELCLWPSLLEADSYSPSLFSALANTTEISPDIFAALLSVLAAGYADDRAGDIRASFAAVMRGHGYPPRTDLFGEIHRSMRACLAPTYFLDQTVSDLNARFFRSVLTAEQTRHRLAEEEATRLHYLRFHDELQSAQQAIAELQDWSKQLQEAARYHQQQAAAADRRTAELTDEVGRLQNLSREAERQVSALQDWSKQLQEAAHYHEQQAAPRNAW